MATIDVKVPDIGDFKDIPVIEVFVKPGDTVAAEDSLVTLESDKATMDVPAPVAGTIKEMKLKVGDKVSEGTLIAVLESAAAAPASQSSAASGKGSAAASAPAPAKAAPTPAEIGRAHV
jgi:pyruvate/2-oxoglutarate dehydrogenase complex dihydrolipoamide acyltransferase (E2) component